MKIIITRTRKLSNLLNDPDMIYKDKKLYYVLGH